MVIFRKPIVFQPTNQLSHHNSYDLKTQCYNLAISSCSRYCSLDQESIIIGSMYIYVIGVLSVFNCVFLYVSMLYMCYHHDVCYYNWPCQIYDFTH